eukprot:5437410-Prymnesium_polylepis.1
MGGRAQERPVGRGAHSRRVARRSVGRRRRRRGTAAARRRPWPLVQAAQARAALQPTDAA